MALCSGHLSSMSRRARLGHGGLGLEGLFGSVEPSTILLTPARLVGGY